MRLPESDQEPSSVASPRRTGGKLASMEHEGQSRGRRLKLGRIGVRLARCEGSRVGRPGATQTTPATSSDLETFAGSLGAGGAVRPVARSGSPQAGDSEGTCAHHARSQFRPSTSIPLAAPFPFTPVISRSSCSQFVSTREPGGRAQSYHSESVLTQSLQDFEPAIGRYDRSATLHNIVQDEAQTGVVKPITRPVIWAGRYLAPFILQLRSERLGASANPFAASR